MNQLSAVDIFSKYHEEQSRSSGDRITAFIKGAMKKVRNGKMISELLLK